MPPIDLVPSISIDNFLAQRDAMIERARVARKALQEIAALAAAMPVPPDGRSHMSWFRLSVYTQPERREFADDHGFNDYIKAIDAACWARLLDLSGLRTFMDSAAREAWDENISKKNVPELTLGNVEATFKELYAVRGEMFERGVVAVFKSLSWDYKTNNPVMFGKRIILRGIYDTRFGFVHVDHGGTNKLDDIMRVFCLLDGKPEPDHRQGAFQRLSAVKLSAPANFDGYFTVRGYKNGNGHLTFLRPDLVEKMNLIVAKHHPGALPPSREH